MAMARNRLLVKTLVFLSALSIPISYYINRLRTLHYVLSSQIAHDFHIGGTELLALRLKPLVSFSESLDREGHQYVLFRDIATKAIQTSVLPHWDEQKLLTSYLRYTWQRFATMPQGWMLWAISSKHASNTFDPAFIRALNFEESDRICGSYVVLHRQPGQVEIGMSMGKPDTIKFIQGRLIIAIDIDKDNKTATISSETLMWRRKDAGTLMPLERSVPKWLHELASWGLIDQGIQHLKQQK